MTQVHRGLDRRSAYSTWVTMRRRALREGARDDRAGYGRTSLGRCGGGRVLGSPVLMCLVAFAIAALPTNASAAPFLTYNLQPFGVTDAFHGSDTLAVTSAAGSNATGSGSGAVRATHGALGAYAEANGQFDVLSTITFQEMLTVTSGSLAAGTPVDLLISLSFDYLLTGSGAGGASLDAFLGLGNAQSGQVSTRFTAFSDLGVTVDQRTAVFHTFVGDKIELVAQLHVGAGAGNCCQTGSGLGDALNTMLFFIDPVGPDPTLFSYLSESGGLYLTPPPPSPTTVPEPATLSLLGAGLASLAARRRRARVHGTSVARAGGCKGEFSGTDAYCPTTASWLLRG